jgi:phosphoglycolate phosphatase
MLKLVIFDWDGTLCDSVARIASCIQLAAAENQMDVPSTQAAADIIGLGLPEATNRLFPGISKEQATIFTASYSAQFRAQDSVPSQFFEGVDETLAQLRANGYLLAVATGKSRAGLDRILAALGMTHFFDASRCADETLSKPNPLMINELLHELSVSPDEAVMVGDTEFDLDMAQRAGVRSIAMTYGAHSEKRLAVFDPIVCLDNFRGIKKYLV